MADKPTRLQIQTTLPPDVWERYQVAVKEERRRTPSDLLYTIVLSWLEEWEKVRTELIEAQEEGRPPPTSKTPSGVFKRKSAGSR